MQHNVVRPNFTSIEPILASSVPHLLAFVLPATNWAIVWADGDSCASAAMAGDMCRTTQWKMFIFKHTGVFT